MPTGVRVKDTGSYERRRWLQGAPWGCVQRAMARDTGSNRTRWSRNSSRMLPVGTFRFLATMISAMLRGYSCPWWVWAHSSSVVYRSSRWSRCPSGRRDGTGGWGGSQPGPVTRPRPGARPGLRSPSLVGRLRPFSRYAAAPMWWASSPTSLRHAVSLEQSWPQHDEWAEARR